MVRPQPRLRRDDAFAHTRRVERQYRRVLEHARAGTLRGGGKAERIIQRMNVDSPRIVDGVKVTFAAQHGAHPVGRPTLDLTTELADKPGEAREFVAVVGLGDVKPAVLRVDTRHRLVANDVADIIHPALRQRPEVLGAVEADAADDAVGARGKTGKHETGIAARSFAGDVARLQQHDGPAGAGNLAGGRQTGKAAADHANINVVIRRQRRPLWCVHHGRGIPTSAMS